MGSLGTSDELDFTAEELKLLREADSPDFLHLNNLKVVGHNSWFAAGDSRFTPRSIDRLA